MSYISLYIIKKHLIFIFITECSNMFSDQRRISHATSRAGPVSLVNMTQFRFLKKSNFNNHKLYFIAIENKDGSQTQTGEDSIYKLPSVQ